jgi:hypothetical protein
MLCLGQWLTGDQLCIQLLISVKENDKTRKKEICKEEILIARSSKKLSITTQMRIRYLISQESQRRKHKDSILIDEHAIQLPLI